MAPILSIEKELDKHSDLHDLTEGLSSFYSGHIADSSHMPVELVTMFMWRLQLSHVTAPSSAPLRSLVSRWVTSFVLPDLSDPRAVLQLPTRSEPSAELVMIRRSLSRRQESESIRSPVHHSPSMWTSTQCHCTALTPTFDFSSPLGMILHSRPKANYLLNL